MRISKSALALAVTAGILKPTSEPAPSVTLRISVMEYGPVSAGMVRYLSSENELAWTFKGGTNDGLPLRAQQAEASRRAHHVASTCNFPPRFHRAQKHVGKRRSCQHRLTHLS